MLHRTIALVAALGLTLPALTVSTTVALHAADGDATTAPPVDPAAAPPVAPALPDAAKKAVSDLASATTKLLDDARVAAEKERTKALRTLEKLEADERKKGNVEVADVIKARREALLSGDDTPCPELLPAGWSGVVPAGKVGPVVTPDAAAAVVAALPSMTVDDWFRIDGKPVIVAANLVTQVRLVVKRGERWLIVPNPIDTWEGGPGQGVTNWIGPANGMTLCWQLGDTVQNVYEHPIIEGGEGVEGDLLMRPLDGGMEDNTGSIRVKILRIK